MVLVDSVAPPPPPAARTTSSSSQKQQQQQSVGAVVRNNNNNNNSSAAQAAESLALLLREDRLLTQYDLHVSGKTEEVSFAYAAALLENDEDDDGASGQQQQQQQHHHDVTQRAMDALAEVNRKLALVESLAERVSRTSPEAVAGTLLTLHGYAINNTNNSQDVEGSARTTATTTTTTLSSIRERCDRLQRQGELLEGVAARVESSLQRGLKRMETATSRLSRVLMLSSTLKMILRLHFESSKLQGYDLDDFRDLTRAAASVAVIEDLLSRPELKEEGTIDIVQDLRPQAEKTATAVRKAAAALLEQHNSKQSSSTIVSSSSSAVVQLSATLQVYYHLGELPQAAWKAVDHALTRADDISAEFWSPTNLSSFTEKATVEAKKSLGSGSSQLQRAIKNKLREFRAEAATKWASGITAAAFQVWNLHRVLCRKSDPVSRRAFVDVVSAAPIPAKFEKFYDKRRAHNANTTHKIGSAGGGADFSIFSIFWDCLCQDTLAVRLQSILSYDNGKLLSDIAALYPSVRSAALNMMGFLQDTMQAGIGAAMALGDDTTTAAAATSSSLSGGILGGSAALDQTFMGGWNNSFETMAQNNGGNTSTIAQGTLGVISADTWTRSDNNNNLASGGDVSASERFSAAASSSATAGSTASTLSMSAIFHSSEWNALAGSAEGRGGLYALQEAFLCESKERLCEPLKYMFPDNTVTVDSSNIDGGGLVAAGGGLPLLPSKYDVQKFDENIRQELSLADPRQGGGEFSAVKMISETVVSMVVQFCSQAKNVLCSPGVDECLQADGSATNLLIHDIKVTKMLYLLTKYIRDAPEKTFIEPYRPATSPQHEETAIVCQAALVPAIQEIEKMVNGILSPLCRALNRRIASVMARIHLGVYTSSESGGAGNLDDYDTEGPSFVQKHLSILFEEIAKNHIAKLPSEYATMIASSIASFSMYTFVSNVFLVRPLGETARLHITQDLADLELVLEQFLSKSGSSLSLGRLGVGGPGGASGVSSSTHGTAAYVELRAVRQMLFWTGLEKNKDKSSNGASEIAKAILREAWIKDVRPSTVFHFLFSFAPSLLSSPYHIKRMKAEDYVSTLVHYDGNFEDGEASAWMTIMACCDSYQQRESVDRGSSAEDTDGDSRIAGILMMLGPELLRRRRQWN